MAESETKKDRFAAKLDQAIAEAIREEEITEAQLATRLGYKSPNIIAMFRTGKTRVPLNLVARMARILHLDPPEFLREWFIAYDPRSLDTIEEVMGGPFMTHAERSWIWGLRHHYGTVPSFQAGWGATLARLVDEPGSL